MEIRKIKNKDGVVLTTKEGVELEELKFEVGDEFVPSFNKVSEQTREVEVKGKKQKITNYSIRCKVRDKNKKQLTHNGEPEFFVSLTPGQAETLKKKIEEGIEITQHVFAVYYYNSKDYGKQIGVGLKKDFKKPISFEDFDNKENKEDIVYSSNVVSEKSIDEPINGTTELADDNEFAN